MARRSELANFWKLTPALAISTAVALLLVAALLALFNERSYREQKGSEISAQAHILASTVTAALAFNDRESANEYVGAMRANPEMRAAAIYDHAGALFASFRRDAARALPVAIVPGEPVFDGDRLAVAAPVTEAGATLGAVYLETETEPVARRLVRYAIIGLLITMASLVVAVLGAAQSALNKANAELERRAVELAATNSQLEAQIAEREKVEAALRQSQKMEAIGQLSGGIAHDFNNLLTVVRGNLELLQLRLAQGRTDVGKLIELATKGLDRAASVTQRMLAFSRQQPLSPKPVQFTRLAQEMADLLRHSLGEHITLDMDLRAGWWVLCDPNQMENAILNLVINARDAMPEGGRLRLETDDLDAAAMAALPEALPAGDYVRLSVRDTGSGMTEEVRQKAIDPFFTTKPQGQGTGLGLSMIFGYVKQSKGYLFIDSVPGQGTCVSILLPCLPREPQQEREAVAAAGEAASGAAFAAARQPTVLIVEDNELVRTLAVETIREEGYVVLEEEDGTAALALLRRHPEVDLLISDVRLPGMSGFQLAEAIRAERPELKVLLMTGFTQDPLPDRLAGAGIRILYKPFKVHDLVAHANRILRAQGQEAT